MKSFVGFTELTCLSHTVNKHGRRPGLASDIRLQG